MEVKEKLIKAIENDELKHFLCGEKIYKVEPSQYAPGAESTDVSKILSKAIYKVYKEQPKIKEEFEKVLLQMLDGTSYEVYMVVLYIMSQLFKEKNGLSPFNINMTKILPKLQSSIANKKEEFNKSLEYPDEFEKKEFWSDMERFKKVCQEEYKIKLF